MHDHTSDLYGMLLLALAALVGAPVSIWRARRGGLERQRAYLWAWLAGGALALLWLDSCALALALGHPSAIGWSSYAPLAAGLTAVCLAVAPYGARELRRLVLGLAALWAWSLCLPWVPWNDEKRAVLDVRAVLGQPLALAQQRLGRYEGEAFDASGRKVAEGRCGELDLARLDAGELRLEPIGGLSLYVVGGRVSDAGFNYD